MKILVSFEPKDSLDNFEGSRLRKTIKGSLEMQNIEYTSNLLDDYDVAHFMSIEDEKKIDVAKEKDVPVIVSALYCEDDPAASFLTFKNRDGEKMISLKAKALKVLNKADLVLVPTDTARTLLLDNGVTSDIQVCLPGLNLARFDLKRDDEKEIFYRYFGEDKNKKIVLALGEYTDNMDGINALINAANKCPNTAFYFIGSDEKVKNTWKMKRVIKKAPKNLKFKGILPDDVYRSALMNSTLFVYTGYSPVGLISIFDAMGAKTQIIIRKQILYPEIFKDGEVAYIAEYSETITSLIKDWLDNKIQPTVENAHRNVSQYDLKYFGERLVWFYKQQIQQKETRRN